MQSKSGDHQFSIADFVSNQTTDDNAETEPREPGAVNQTDLQAGESELCGPGVEQVAADCETDSRRQDRHEPGGQQAFGIRCNSYIADFGIAHDGGRLKWRLKRLVAMGHGERQYTSYVACVSTPKFPAVKSRSEESHWR